MRLQVLQQENAQRALCSQRAAAAAAAAAAANAAAAACGAPARGDNQ